MKRSWLLLLVISMLAWCNRKVGVQFIKSDFDTARQQAQTTQKKLLTYFYTEW